MGRADNRGSGERDDKEAEPSGGLGRVLSLVEERRGTVLVALFLLAFAVRLILALFSPIDDDETWYLYDSYNVSRGLVPYIDFHTRSPVLLYTVALFIRLFGPSVIAGRMVSALAASASTVLVYVIAERVSPYRWSPLLASIFFAFLPFSVRWSSTLSTEPMAVAITLLGVYLFLRGYEDRKNHYLMASGFMFFLAVLTRRSAAVVPLSINIYVALVTFSRSGDILAGPKRIRYMTIFFLSPFFIFLILLSAETSVTYVLSLYLYELWDQAPLFPYLHWNVSGVFYYVFAAAVLPMYLIFRRMTAALSPRHAAIGASVVMAVLPVLFAAFVQSDMTDLYGVEFLKLNMGYSGPILAMVILLSVVPFSAMVMRHCEDGVEAVFPLAIYSSTAVLAGAVASGHIRFTDTELRPFLFLWIIALVVVYTALYIESMKEAYDRQSRAFLSFISYMVIAGGAAYMVAVIRRSPTVLPAIMAVASSFVVAMIVFLLLSRAIHTLVGYGHISAWAMVLLTVLAAVSHPLPLENTILLAAVAVVSVSSAALVVRPSWMTASVFMLIAGTSILFMLPALPFAALMLFAALWIWLPRAGVAAFDEVKHDGLDILSSVFLGFALFYITRNWILPIYFYDMLPYASVFMGVYIASMASSPRSSERVEGAVKRRFAKSARPGRSKNTAGGVPTAYWPFLALTLLSLTVSAGVYSLNTYYYRDYIEFHPQLSTVEEVGDYVHGITVEDEAILAWPIYAYAADRPVIFNMSRPFGYLIGYINMEGYRNVEDVMDYMDEHHTRIVVVDINLRTYWLNSDQRLSSYIEHNYVLVKVIDDVEIYQRVGT